MEHRSAAKPHEDNAIGHGDTAESHEDTAENLHRRKCASVACLQPSMRSHDREIEISTQHDAAGMRQSGFILHGNADQSLGIKADRVRRQWLSVIDDERVPGIRLHEGAETPIRVDIVGHHDATWP